MCALWFSISQSSVFLSISSVYCPPVCFDLFSFGFPRRQNINFKLNSLASKRTHDNRFQTPFHLLFFGIHCISYLLLMGIYWYCICMVHACSRSYVWVYRFDCIHTIHTLIKIGFQKSICRCISASLIHIYMALDIIYFLLPLFEPATTLTSIVKSATWYSNRKFSSL